MRKFSRPLKYTLAIIIFLGFTWIIIAESLDAGGKTCAIYYNTRCKYYNYIIEECVCEHGRYFLNNTMIEQRNKQIEAQNTIFRTGYINVVPNFSKYVVNGQNRTVMSRNLYDEDNHSVMIRKIESDWFVIDVKNKSNKKRIYLGSNEENNA